MSQVIDKVEYVFSRKRMGLRFKFLKGKVQIVGEDAIENRPFQQTDDGPKRNSINVFSDNIQFIEAPMNTGFVSLPNSPSKALSRSKKGGQTFHVNSLRRLDHVLHSFPSAPVSIVDTFQNPFTGESTAYDQSEKSHAAEFIQVSRTLIVQWNMLTFFFV